MENKFFPGEELKPEELEHVIGGAENCHPNDPHTADPSSARSSAKGWNNNVPGWEGQWFYFDDDGNMFTGWHMIDGRWCYLMKTVFSVIDVIE